MSILQREELTKLAGVDKWNLRTANFVVLKGHFTQFGMVIRPGDSRIVEVAYYLKKTSGQALKLVELVRQVRSDDPQFPVNDIWRARVVWPVGGDYTEHRPAKWQRRG